MRINSFLSKLLLIVSVLLVTYLYARYERNKYYSANENSSNELVLKNLPTFNSVEVSTGQLLNSQNILKSSSGLFVHIWGTWCGPCEKEMPEFLKYAETVEPKGVKFLLVAVNDEEMKIKKFMARYSIPKNVIVVIDKDNSAMEMFGTMKVPETFLFDKLGKHINKFIGPQEWLQESYQTRLDFWLNTKNSQDLAPNSQDRKIETH